ncbi:hypothetical protein KC946_03965 [Candidatus Saccharibacteria bacterium]|nr:hypothetical protein [Candidatus Saccharibacteria bacterium]
MALTKQKPTFMIKKIYLVLIIFLLGFTLSSVVLSTRTVFAAESGTSFSRCNDTEECDITRKLVDPAIKLLTFGVGIVVTTMIIIAGIQYSSAGNDPQKVSAAKSKISNAILALLTYIFFLGLLQWLWPGGLV